jgi:hypothetical protein
MGKAIIFMIHILCFFDTCGTNVLTKNLYDFKSMLEIVQDAYYRCMTPSHLLSRIYRIYGNQKKVLHYHINMKKSLSYRTQVRKKQK